MAEVLYVADDYVADGYTQVGITIDWGTRTIFVPTFAMLLLQTVPSKVYQLDLNDFWLALKDLEDTEAGMMFPDTHIRKSSTTVSGAVLAPVVELINDYAVIFEELDEGYRVNAVGANSNIGERQLINSVSLSTSNSAGLQDLNSLQAASFGGEVSVNITSAYSGTTFPVGTRSNPVNNIANALAIAESRGISTINIMNSMTLGAGDFTSGFTFKGDNPVKVTLTIDAAAEIDNCTFTNMTIQGVLDNSNVLRECSILDISHINGFMFQCSIAGTVTLGGNAQAMIMDCYSGIAGQSSTIDMGGSGNALSLSNFNGNLNIINSVGITNSSLFMNSGKITFDNTCTDGNFTIQGIAEVIDNSNGAVVNDATETKKAQINVANTTTSLAIALGQKG